MKTTRRRILAGAAGTLLARHAGAVPPWRGGSGVPSSPPPPPPPPPGGSLGTVTFVNDGASTSVAGTPTQSFGWLFKKGDVPAGVAPRFSAGGVDQPFSASVPSMRDYYDDGSLKHAYFSLRPTFTVPAGLSQAVGIFSGGGTWPSDSGRTLAEVYAQNLVLNMPAAPISGANLSGTWGAWCKNDTNLITSGAMAPLKDMDGDAGARFRVSVNMAQTQGGGAHGQLVGDFYIHALNNASGNLGGFRFGAYARQPWFDVNSPAKNWRAFARPDYSTPTNGPNWSASGVSATPMGFKGADGNPMLPVNFTGTFSANIRNNTVGIVNAQTNWWLGGMDGNVIPVYFTTTGTLPAPLQTNTIYFAEVFNSGTGYTTGLGAAIFSGSLANPSFLLNLSGGSGTHTMVPVPCLTQFCRLGFKDDNARYLFFRGSGTIAAETTLRAQIDQVYWQSTGVLAPFDLTLIGSGSVTDTPFNNLWHPHTIGSNEEDADGATGVLQCLGIFPNDAVIDYYKQTARSERAIRCCAETWCHVPGDFKRSTTNNLPSLSGSNYTGVTNNPSVPNDDIVTLQYSQNPATAGFTGPPSNAYGMGLTSTGSTEHQPGYPHWAWLRTGQFEYRDFTMEMAAAGIFAEEIGKRSTSIPVATRYGLAWSHHNQWRTIAWRARNLAFAASFCGYDPTHPTTLGVDGSLAVKMMVDNSDLGYQQVVDTQVTTNNYYGSHTSNFVAKGRWTPKYDFDGIWLVISPEWEYAYTIYVACLEAARSGSASNIINFITRSAKYWDYYRTAYGPSNTGFYSAFAYYVGWGVENAGNSHVGTVLMDGEFTTASFNGGTMSWQPTATAGSGFEFTDNMSWANGYSLHNGDFVVPDSPRPAGLGPTDIVYVRNYNASTRKFGLARDKAGTTPITITDSGTSNSVGGFVSNPLDWHSHNAPNAMDTDNLLSMRAAIYWMKAALSRQGVYSGTVQTQLEALISDVENRRLNTPGGPYSTIRDVSYAGQHFSDMRYCYAQTFG